MGEQKTGIGQAYLLFGASVLLVLAVGFAMQAVQPRAGLVITELLCILAPAIVFVRRKSVPLRSALRLNPISFGLALMSLATGVCTWGVAVSIHSLISRALGSAPKSAALEPHSQLEWALLVIAAAVLPALCEEALFRGAIQGILERRGAISAVATTAVLFGIFHLDPWSAVPAMFLGLVLGTLVVRTGSTLSSMLAHFANNATAVSVGYFFHGSSNESNSLVAALCAGFVLVAGAAWYSTRHLRIDPPLLASVPAGLGSVSRPSLLKFVVAPGIVLLILIGAGIARTVDFRRVETALLEPALHRGDTVVLVHLNAKQQARMKQGHIVTFKQSGSEHLGRISRAELAQVFIQTESGEVAVPREGLIGVAVYPPAARVLPKK